MTSPHPTLTAARPLTEAQFMEQVTELAELFGWEWIHIRHARTKESWRTPISGPLGKGWPDLVMIRQRDHRLLFVELKSDNAYATHEQDRVLGNLMTTEHYREACGCKHGPDVRVELWRPEDWELIERTLR
jgi:hypothetical protein